MASWPDKLWELDPCTTGASYALTFASAQEFWEGCKRVDYLIWLAAAAEWRDGDRELVRRFADAIYACGRAGAPSFMHHRVEYEDWEDAREIGNDASFPARALRGAELDEKLRAIVLEYFPKPPKYLEGE